MSTSDTEHVDATSRIELAGVGGAEMAAGLPSPPDFAPTVEPDPVSPTYVHVGDEQVGSDVLYVPLAVTVGDGFKFGCGFFMALILTLLLGFVLAAALVALVSVMGLNLPVSR